MNILINPVNFNIEASLNDHTQKKMEKLYGLYEGIVGIEVNYKLENNTEDSNKTAEVRVKVPGNDLFAGKTTRSFEESLDACMDALRKQVEKHKERHR